MDFITGCPAYLYGISGLKILWSGMVWQGNHIFTGRIYSLDISE